MPLIFALNLCACVMVSIASHAVPTDAEDGAVEEWLLDRDRVATAVAWQTDALPVSVIDNRDGPDAQGKGVADLMLVQLGSITSNERALSAPDVVETNVSPKGDQWQIDLVWKPLPGPRNSLFVVELVTIPSGSDDESELVAFEQTEASATTVYVDRVPVGLAWRVSQVAADGARYAAGMWRELNPGTERSAAESALSPVGRVTIRVGTADMPARQLARELASALAGGGVWTHLEEVELDQAESSVAYRFTADAELASSVASLLPVLGPEAAMRLVELPAAPGEIVVNLVGGPIDVDDAD